VHAMEIASDLQLTSTAPTADVTEGTTARITYELRNQGPFAASLISLSGTYSQTAASTTIQSTRGTCTRSAGTFTCAIGSLASGNVATVTLDFTAAVGSFSASAFASGHERDISSGDNAAQASVNVVSAPSPPTQPPPSQPNPPSQPSPPTNVGSSGGGGGGTTGLFELFVLLLLAGLARWSARSQLF
jgi:hypothetical protein